MANPNNQNPPLGMNNNEAPPMPNLRSMEEMLQAPFDGVRRAIVLLAVQAHFEIHHGLLNLLSNHSYHGLDHEDPREHLRNFSDIVETYQVNNVPNEVIKMKLFQFSLKGAARTWLDKEPPNSIFSWNDLATKFINKFCPPSKTSTLRSQLFCFQQGFDETFGEAWDRFKDMLERCPNHGFTELHQM